MAAYAAHALTHPPLLPLPFRRDDGIVVVEVGPHHARNECAMQVNEVPEPLRSRLGPAATAGLLELLSMSHQRERAALIEAMAGRFERRLGEESAALRIEMANLRADVRQEIAAQVAGLRQEMASQGAEQRREMTTLWSGLRGEMQAQGSDLRSELAAGRSELLKWCFLFGIGQVVALGTLMGVRLRLAR